MKYAPLDEVRDLPSDAGLRKHFQGLVDVAAAAGLFVLFAEGRGADGAGYRKSAKDARRPDRARYVHYGAYLGDWDAYAFDFFYNR